MLLLATLLWGLSYSIQTLGAGTLGSFTIVFFKGFGGVLLLIPILMMKKKIGREELKEGFLIGLLAFFGCILQQRGMELSAVSKASFITALYIVVVPLIESFSGKKVKSSIWLAIFIALIGLYFLCFSSSFTLQTGDILLLLCSVFFAFQIVLTDRYTIKSDPIVLTFVGQSTICIFSSIIMFVMEKPTAAQIGGSIWLILYIALMSGLVAQTIQNSFQKDVGPSLASLLMSFESVFGALFGWFILHQVLSIKELFGCALVFIAILIAELK